MKKVVVVIQARTNSSRLPAKVLLPLGGYPIAVLAAKRVMGEDKTVIIATSNEPGDDYLAHTASSHGVNVFRGSLNDVLSRYVECLSSYSGDTVVVRLTADNVFPCSDLIDEFVDDFLSQAYDYLCLNGELSGLPYGVAAEAMRLDKLRESHDEASSPSDLEHVTPYIRRKYGAIYFKKYLPLDLGMYRCTIDSFSDYIDMVDLFKNVSDPLNVSTFELIELLKKKYPLVAKNNRKIILGSAQFGLNYGINNTTGKPSKEVCFSILSEAVTNGVEYIDTASAYGDSESVIGEWLSGGWRERVNVITKLSPLTSLNSNINVQEIYNAVDTSLYQSLLNLKLDKLDVLMLHRTDHLVIHDGAIFTRLIEWKKQNKITSLGVSIQSPDELILALNHPEVKYIQMPFNILDDRWDTAISRLIDAKKDREINVHVRSVYLQGLLLTDSDALWDKANVESSHNIISWLTKATASLGYKNRATTCINYVISHDWVDAIVLGVDTVSHLDDAFSYIYDDKISQTMLNKINESRPVISEVTLNPALWKNK